jgi:hypothetical protein
MYGIPRREVSFPTIRLILIFPGDLRLLGTTVDPDCSPILKKGILALGHQVRHFTRRQGPLGIVSRGGGGIGSALVRAGPPAELAPARPRPG